MIDYVHQTRIHNKNTVLECDSCFGCIGCNNNSSLSSFLIIRLLRRSLVFTFMLPSSILCCALEHSPSRSHVILEQAARQITSTPTGQFALYDAKKGEVVKSDRWRPPDFRSLVKIAQTEQGRLRSLLCA